MRNRKIAALLVLLSLHPMVGKADSITDDLHALATHLGGVAVGVGIHMARRYAAGPPPYRGEVYSEVKDAIFSDPYEDGYLPHHQLSLSSMGPFFYDMYKAAHKTVFEDKSAIQPAAVKLVHPNGICFTGTWTITENTPYTGYFKKGASGLVIARASSANGSIYSGQNRPLGIAGRIFPTTDPNDKRVLPTANFFTIDDLGGTSTPRFMDSTFKDSPPVTLFHHKKPGEQNEVQDEQAEADSRTFAGRAESLEAPALTAGIAAVFRAVDVHPTQRQVYEVAELGLKDKNQARSPKRMELVFASNQKRVNEADFRKELDLKKHGGKLVLDILVSSETNYDNMRKVGEMVWTQDVASKSCDERYHVAHPPWVEKFENAQY